MAGGAGNDTYVVDNAGDVVTETAGDGTDTVESALTADARQRAREPDPRRHRHDRRHGNALANVLRGNAAANVLDGGVGADSMFGGAGDDTYVVDNVGDVVSEAPARAATSSSPR